MNIIFVYNAKSGLLNKSFDIAHKIFSPDTYSCDLCGLTHGNFSEKKTWKSFRENSTIEMEFMYKDEFQKKYPDLNGLEFPVILQKDMKAISVIIDSIELASLQSTKALITILNEKILSMKS
ncbi:GTPase [Aquimarina mytili]|uniref:GTPase n=1 Tax=Aquimarina mytili TaxID=874423 RepID=A0A936ZPQ0_9FLAO|nr:GTPase [Aquimarina mytili]MBL0683459.1 GTPase [Aquimarina mytili]